MANVEEPTLSGEGVFLLDLRMKPPSIFNPIVSLNIFDSERHVFDEVPDEFTGRIGTDLFKELLEDDPCSQINRRILVISLLSSFDVFGVHLYLLPRLIVPSDLFWLLFTVIFTFLD